MTNLYLCQKTYILYAFVNLSKEKDMYNEYCKYTAFLGENPEKNAGKKQLHMRKMQIGGIYYGKNLYSRL